ncbi:DISARM system helicase DrmA [Peribacillus asahii]|uniref:DISARM system helicase DrmA n=1 Tax=Peribacillus asahii TaxID=228899 RepID=UPI00207AC163|nr:DISARM system helicase DrmA [Peribacillus asahii]USK68576.1 DISARM system helicase DrmA [Peribacillus asahii]
MKPGATKLLNFLKLNSFISISDYKQVDPKWSKKTLFRVVDEHSELFEMKGDQVTLLSNQPTINFDQYTNTRTEIVHSLEKYLVGPFEESEILGERKRPMSLYLTGKLVPFGSTSNVENESEQDIQTNQLLEDEKADEYLTNRDLFRPSSMGFSFKMKKLTPIEITANWGMYHDQNHRRSSYQESWKIQLKPNHAEVLENKNTVSHPARVKYTVLERDGLYHVSLFLYNSFLRDNTYPLQSEIMFQTKLSVSLERNQMEFFTSKADRFNVADELLYRDFQELAIGHGVGVDWQIDEDTVRIESTWLPFYELPSVEHTTLDGNVFSMKELSEMSATELKEALSIIPREYNAWLNTQKSYITELDSHLQKEAKKNIAKVENIIGRIEAGILLITESDECIAKKAFQFANRSMMIQQAQTKVALTFRSSNKRVKPIYNGKWRLFQIMFLLMNISGASDPNHEDREVVDLIWFPTGGGKTEAYLGVAAYLMAYRRLSANVQNVEEYAGVTVFMRYTLRLLTTQQFQRATALICAAEYIRQEQPYLYGEVPFSIGLWIGADSSPNKLADASQKLEEIKSGTEVLKGNPMQLTHCPWCGTELEVDDYTITDKLQQIGCHYPQCNFHGGRGLPVYTVDEAIYNHVPTIIIGTVDKVAQLPWKDDMYELFGQKNFYNSDKGFIYDDKKLKRGYQKINRLKPPELIIQDELHLISGPLGSLTGLYEVAVDLLCEHQGRPAKIIASTATIRGADEQIAGLYGREVNQFPLAVRKADDNFVSYSCSTKEKPGRLYLGICAPGVSSKIQSIQTYSALAMITRTSDSTNIDPYWTMLGYFNTVKELSGMLTTFKDEIPSRLDMLDTEKLFLHDLHVEEMTSRKKAKEIPELLTAMEKSKNELGALDAVLATNMISVGVDVNRLGIMIVHGQPKTTSEYIQATSRVGRTYPGLVLTIFNSMRSRDLSHYERFKMYHQTLYRNVEAMSVTPFAMGSRKKGLIGSFVGFLRQSLLDISKEQGANKFRQTEEVEQLKQKYLERISRTRHWDVAEADQTLSDILIWWEQVAARYNEKLSYKKNDYVKGHLLKQFNEKAKTLEAKPAMMSLRNVEGEILVEEMWMKHE